ncbi:MAG: Holliday junction resolvase RuvX [Rhodobiaceae bacterium]|nr:Holliday junction resolvase RuvX [Rhodobiaceae bacterium]
MTGDSHAIEVFAGHIPAAGALMGLDPGTKTIGVALSDRSRLIATPFHVIMRGKFAADAANLLKFANENAVAGIIVGLPRNMDGTEGPRAQSVRAFVRNLEKLTELPIGFWDERLSTHAAERAMIEADMSRAKRKARIDAAAAAYILQGALDFLARRRLTP